MASDNEYNSDQENIINKLCIKEELTYPLKYQVNYESKNQLEENNHIQSIVKAVNHRKISRDSYRDLAIADYYLTREYIIFNKQIEITNYMNQKIKLSLVDMKEKNILENIEFEELNITDSEIVQEV
ncbi:10089_t:CDS:2 [Diversispora eburnea]|uniref:10089_t:CDS:1 n=1 Tax=Diversispora eburnea TaxID=1213867 RepID=A0A9N9CT68_9GLOM|nr:10089_t:CDS:2 [Diversispora eburnea]